MAVPLFISLPQLIVLGQLLHQFGFQILDSEAVRQTGRKAGNGRRELISAGFRRFMRQRILQKNAASSLLAAFSWNIKPLAGSAVQLHYV